MVLWMHLSDATAASGQLAVTAVSSQLQAQVLLSTSLGLEFQSKAVFQKDGWKIHLQSKLQLKIGCNGTS